MSRLSRTTTEADEAQDMAMCDGPWTGADMTPDASDVAGCWGCGSKSAPIYRDGTCRRCWNEFHDYFDEEDSR